MGVKVTLTNYKQLNFALNKKRTVFLVSLFDLYFQPSTSCTFCSLISMKLSAAEKGIGGQSSEDLSLGLFFFTTCTP